MARGTSWDENEEDKKAKAEKAEADKKAGKTKDQVDPLDPAADPGNTGNSPKLGPGVKKTPTPAEDEEAKEKAKSVNDEINEALSSGYRKAAQLEGEALREGVSTLGKEAIVVQDDDGNPVVGRRGMSSVPGTGASATNPALAANDAIPAPAAGPADQAELDKLAEEGKTVVPLHGTGAQPSAG